MSMLRNVQPEMLDALAADDPRAIRSRSDLRRINRVLGSSEVIATSLDPMIVGTQRAQIIELGAGDGTMMLRIARSRARQWPKIRLNLIDMQPVVHTETLTGFRDLGWDAQIVGADVFDWFGLPEPRDPPIVVANLFVHHFEGERLHKLIHGVAAQAKAFVCCEPRRSRFALTGSYLVGAMGCNKVTRHDAVASVRAGFRGRELSELWPNKDAWTLQEGRVGTFCHRFVAVRKDA